MELLHRAFCCKTLWAFQNVESTEKVPLVSSEKDFQVPHGSYSRWVRLLLFFLGGGGGLARGMITC